MTIQLSATNLQKTFQHGPAVLRGIDLTAQPGTLTAIRGRAGSGRSTLLRCLTGGYRVDAGTVDLRTPHGTQQLTQLDPRNLSWTRQHFLAIFDGPIPTAPSQTCEGVVQRSTGATAEDTLEALERLNIAQFADVAIGRLRPQHRATVALAAALLDPAPVVILDTPEAAADDHVVTDWVHELTRSGKAIIITTTHESSMLADSAHHTATLREGTLQWD